MARNNDMLRSLWFSLAFLLLACSSSQPAASAPAPAAASDRVAYFAGGCFWGVEHFMEQLEGVASVDSGYAGGTTESPSYQDVIYKGTGHLEVVRVRFDSTKTNYKKVAKRFFEIHDPTQADGQGPDIGEQYKSAVFYTSASQKSDAQDLVSQLEARGFKVATTLREFSKFWPAEQYHQDYYVKKRSEPYCHLPVDRFGDAQ